MQKIRYAVSIHLPAQRLHLRRRVFIIPLTRKKFVEGLHWIEEQEMLDLTAIAQSSPGAIGAADTIYQEKKGGGAR